MPKDETQEERLGRVLKAFEVKGTNFWIRDEQTSEWKRQGLLWESEAFILDNVLKSYEVKSSCCCFKIYPQVSMRQIYDSVGKEEAIKKLQNEGRTEKEIQDDIDFYTERCKTGALTFSF